MQKSCIEILLGLIFTGLSTLYPKRPLGNNVGKDSSSQNLSFIKDTGCLPSPGAIFTISSPNITLYVFKLELETELSEKGVAELDESIFVG